MKACLNRGNTLHQKHNPTEKAEENLKDKSRGFLVINHRNIDNSKHLLYFKTLAIDNISFLGLHYLFSESSWWKANIFRKAILFKLDTPSYECKDNYNYNLGVSPG